MQLKNQLINSSQFLETSFMDNFMKQVSEDIEKKKEDLIKKKLTERGFAHLIPGIEIRRFPKICAVRRGDWSYYYADNDTEKGAFIIAIQDYKYSPLPDLTEGENLANYNFSFAWHDNSELESLK